MPASVVCPGCGRRVTIPDTIDPHKARCPRCRVKLGPAADAEPVARTPAKTPAAHAPGSPTTRGLTPPGSPTTRGLTPPGSPGQTVYSLDDAQPLPDAHPKPAAPSPPPPFRFPAQVVADSFNHLRGALAVVLTPVGLFLEYAANQPILFAPVGTRAEAEGRMLVLSLPDRVITLRLGGVGPVERLADDCVAFLAGTRFVPEPGDYRRTGMKVALIVGACIALVSLVFVASLAYLMWAKQDTPPPGAQPGQPAPPDDPGPPPPPPEPLERPPSYTDVAYAEGKSRLDDGPAEATALVVLPDGSIGVGYANGETRFWAWDQPTFDPPRPGPKADGPVTRIEFDAPSATFALTCPGGVVVSPRSNPPRTPVKLPGDPVAVIPEGKRFAAVRGGRVLLRNVPFELVKSPSPARAINGVVPTIPKEETATGGTPKGDYTVPGGKATFLAWHPAGKLLGGSADGTIVTWAGAAAMPTPVTKEHTAAVRAWAAAPATFDFATGDDAGFVGFWPDKALKPTKAKVAPAAVTQLAFSWYGQKLLVADAGAGLTVWDVAANRAAFRVVRPTAPKAVAFGPWDDVVLIADGKAVEFWWLPELAKQAK